MGRIAIVTQSYPDPTQIPSSSHIARLFDGKTAVVCRSARPDLNLDKPYHVASTGAARGDWLPMLFEQSGNLLRGLSGRVPVGRNRRALEEFLRSQQVDAILAEFGTEGVWIWPIARRLGLPFHVYFRGYDATAFLAHPRRRAGRVRAYEAMIDAADSVFAVSDYLFRALEAHGLDLSGGFVIPSGVDTDSFRPHAKDPSLFVAVGRFIEKKAPDITLRAFALAVADHPDAHLEFIGDGPLLPACVTLVENLGLGGRITFHGAKDHNFVRGALGRASVFLQHSVTAPNGDQEGAPTSIQEAMAAGACVISTRHAGIPDLVVQHETGILVDERDEKGYAAAIASVLANPERTKRQGMAGRERAVSRFDRGLSDKHIEAAIRGQTVPDWRRFLGRSSNP